MIKYDKENGTLQIKGSTRTIIADLAALVFRVCFNITDNEQDCKALADGVARFIQLANKVPEHYQILAKEAEHSTTINLSHLMSNRE